MDKWSIDSRDSRNWYPDKCTLLTQLIRSLSNYLEQPFTRNDCTFDYIIIGFALVFTRKFHWNWISEVQTKLIETGSKWKTSDQNDPSDWKNPAITLDSKSHDPADWKVQNKCRFVSFHISWIFRITDPSVQTNRTLIS